MALEHVNALNRFAAQHSRRWRAILWQCWDTGHYPEGTSAQDQALLQQVRHQQGALVQRFTPREGGYRDVAYLQKDQTICVSRHETVEKGWRLVSETGRDWVQPWCPTKTAALETADELGLFISGTLH